MVAVFSNLVLSLWIVSTFILKAQGQDQARNPFKSRGSSLVHQPPLTTVASNVPLKPAGLLYETSPASNSNQDLRRRQLSNVPVTIVQEEASLEPQQTNPGSRQTNPPFLQSFSKFNNPFSSTPSTTRHFPRNALNGVMVPVNVQSFVPKTIQLEDRDNVPVTIESPVQHRFEVDRPTLPSIQIQEPDLLLFSSTQISTQTTIDIESTTTEIQTTTYPEELLDPCDHNLHAVIPNEVQRSFNHQWVNESGSVPVCDNHLAIGWYRFEAVTGNLMPTKCPEKNSCGTQMSVWLRGNHPSTTDGIISAIGCIRREQDCCFEELPLKIRNCSSGHILYHLAPTPGCNMGYCAGEGLPCPEGFTSESGYSPCKILAKLQDVLLSVSESSTGSEVILKCHPMLENVLDPTNIAFDFQWFVDDQLSYEETFPLIGQPFGTLPQKFWRPGQTITCSVRIKHTFIETEILRKSSQPFLAGIEFSSDSSKEVVEGEPGALISLRSTIPIICSPSSKDCCLLFEKSIVGSTEKDTKHCHSMSDHLPIKLSQCSIRICKTSWNETISIPLTLRPGRSSVIGHNNIVEISFSIIDSNDYPLWNDYKLTGFKVVALPSPVIETCHVSSPTTAITTFDGINYKQNENGTFVLYRHLKFDYEVQGHFNPCNLRQLCLCALAIRSNDVNVYFDICSKGHFQMWASRRNGDIQEELGGGLSVYSRNEGRSFEVNLPSGGQVLLDSLLTEVKILASPMDLNQTQGLCGSFDHSKINDIDVANETSDSITKLELFLSSWKLDPQDTLFVPRGDLNASQTISEDSNQYFEESGSCTLVKEDPLCQGDVSILARLLALGSSADYDGVVRLEVNKEIEEESDFQSQFELEAQLDHQHSTVLDQVAEISLPSSQIQAPLTEDWTRDSAFVFCENLLQKSASYINCQLLPEFDVHSYVRDCREDLFFSHNPDVTHIHLNRLKSECREALFRNLRLVERQEGQNTLSNVSQHLSPEPRKLLYFEEIGSSLCPNDCSGKGNCIVGRCECIHFNGSNHMGGDCSVNMSAGPRVSSLANFGLCDVRTKPCRDVVVLTDHLADDPSLHCVFEVYKVQGVASKQLVNDGQIDAPLVFLSHEQAVCRLPKLDIHEPDDVTKFDLGDNTDHTRFFLKLHLAYGDGPRSSPLDLLLYDSVCWDCTSTGQCRANIREHRCFFSSGTSTVQVFRIGRKITTISKGEIRDFHVCTLPKDSGSCDNKIFRYYYNAIERRCKLFVYGGCKGNENNFYTELQCIQRCGDEQALANLQPVVELPTTTTEIDTCSLSRDEGICPGNVPRFYYDQELARCLIFSYGGCGGNSNNFESLDECVAHCGGPADSFINVGFKAILKPKKNFCKLPLSKGNCQATLRRFYFDDNEGICKLFIFGGCQGNLNNFERLEDCLLNCAGPDEDEVKQGQQILGSESRNLNQTRIIPKQSQIEADTLEVPLHLTTTVTTPVCQLQKDFGTCSSNNSLKFYYDPGSRQCRKFWFSGCGGNENNFASALDCIKTCGGTFETESVQGSISTGLSVVEITTPTTRESSPPKRQLSRFGASNFFKSRSNVTRAENLSVIPAKLQRSDPLPVEIVTFETLSHRNHPTFQPKSERVEKVTLPSLAKAKETRQRESVSTTPVPVSSTSKPRFVYRQRESTTVSPESKARILVETTPASSSNQRSFVVRTRPKHSHSSKPEQLFEEPLSTSEFEEQESKTTKSEEVLRPEKIPEISLADSNFSPLEVSEPAVKTSTDVKQETSIRSFCRSPPLFSDISRCSRPDPIYFYNVTLSDCQSSTKGFCGRSRNRFSSKDACISACIVKPEQDSVVSEVQKSTNTVISTNRKFSRKFGLK